MAAKGLLSLFLPGHLVDVGTISELYISVFGELRAFESLALSGLFMKVLGFTVYGLRFMRVV